MCCGVWCQGTWWSRVCVDNFGGGNGSGLQRLSEAMLFVGKAFFLLYAWPWEFWIVCHMCSKCVFWHLDPNLYSYSRLTLHDQTVLWDWFGLTQRSEVVLGSTPESTQAWSDSASAYPGNDWCSWRLVEDVWRSHGKAVVTSQADSSQHVNAMFLELLEIFYLLVREFDFIWLCVNRLNPPWMITIVGGLCSILSEDSDSGDEVPMQIVRSMPIFTL